MMRKFVFLSAILLSSVAFAGSGSLSLSGGYDTDGDYKTAVGVSVYQGILGSLGYSTWLGAGGKFYHEGAEDEDVKWVSNSHSLHFGVGPVNLQGGVNFSKDIEKLFDEEVEIETEFNFKVSYKFW